MQLSVIIVNYNVKYFLEQCLQSVLKAGAGIAMEVFVVDNNSVDGSVEMVREKFPTVQLIANTDNKGFSSANNQAIRLSSGAYCLLLNPDTVVEEDTFRKVLEFMDAHPDAGGLGVKMIDGAGKFLPESKRGLPTPMVAFYKIFGLSLLFPKSRIFGRYHLGFLDNEKIHEVDVLAGAFMLLRRETLDKTGLLDESFFMYGEDIDLSYRIQQAGYKNYYFPETRIIHYKGESTKKSSINYVFVFYNAMIIFARKHFSPSNARLFSFLIRVAIYLRAGAALFMRFLKRMMLPGLDFLALFSGMYFLQYEWGTRMLINYPPEFLKFAVPAYILSWQIAVYFSGGYDRPVQLLKIIRGIFVGTVLILVVYALLPEAYRFSRALILMGALSGSVSLVLIRLILKVVFPKSFLMAGEEKKRLLIAGSQEESARVLSLLKLSGTDHQFIGFLTPDDRDEIKSVPASGEFDKYNLGSSKKLREVVDIYNIDEVIFCARDIASNQIINFMSGNISRPVEYKIAPPESLFIIGSNSVDNPGELYVLDINSITRNINQRNKRLLDVILSLVFIPLIPLAFMLIKNTFQFIRNIFSVLFGFKSWVAYSRKSGSHQKLPKIKPGVLSPADGFQHPLDEATISRLNALYAKDYSVYTDLAILRRSWRNLGS